MWERVSNFVHSKTVLSVLLLSIIFTLVVTILGVILLGLTLPLKLVFFTIGQLILAIIAIWLMRKLEVFDDNDFRFHGI